MKKFLVSILCICSYSYADKLIKGSDKPKYTQVTTVGSCYEYDKFKVITKDTSSGESILIKNSNKYNCAWKESEGWVIDSKAANFFAGVYKNKIIIDNGTLSSPRDVLIYDAVTKKQLFSDKYFVNIQISEGKLIYWKSSKSLATKNNCDVFRQAMSTGLDAKLMDRVVVNLSNGKFDKQRVIVQRCELTQ